MSGAGFKYIYENEFGFTLYDKYFNYLKSIRDQLSAPTYDFFSDIERYAGDSGKSLHDAWVDKVNVVQGDAGRNEDFSINIVLIGPFHDRRFSIVYSGVRGFDLRHCGTRRRPGRQDLLAHELRMNAEGKIEHLIDFDDGLCIYVVCDSLAVDEELISL